MNKKVEIYSIIPIELPLIIIDFMARGAKQFKPQYIIFLPKFEFFEIEFLALQSIQMRGRKTNTFHQSANK